MTSITLNTRSQKRRRTEDPGTLFDEIVKSAHELLDASLRGGHGLSKSSRIQDLSALRKELEVSKRLEAYCQERVAHLTQEVGSQEKIREDHRLLRLPRLPTEILLKILSYFPSGYFLNLPGDGELMVRVSGILPDLILKPGLLLPPYCNDCEEVQTLDELFEEGPNLKLSILTDVDIARSVKLDVGIHDWPLSGIHEDSLRLLFQVSDRWADLLVRYDDTADIIQMISYFSPYLLNIQRLRMMAGDYLEPSPLPSTTGITLTTPSLKTVNISPYILPIVFDCGILNFVSELILDFGRIGDHLGTQSYDPTNLVQILSSLPHLNTITLNGNGHNPIDKDRVFPKVRSSTLQHIRLVDFGTRDSGNDPYSLLALFQDCPIQGLDLDFWRLVSRLPSVLFPDLKKIKFFGEESLDFFSSPGPNGKFVFPQVEELSFNGGFEYGRLRELTLKAVQSRSCTPGVAPIKRIYLYIWSPGYCYCEPHLLTSLPQLKRELESLVGKVEFRSN